VNNQQAKETLLLYRPGVADPDDPDFSAALELTQREPELGRWFAEHCRLQEALHARFSQLPVPEGLKEQILSERKVVTHPGFSRKALLLCAVAAVVLVLASALVFFRQPGEDNSFSNFRNRMASTVLRQYPKMDLETHDLSQIQHYLAQHGNGDYVLPPALAKAAATGCATLSWHEKELSMLCFNSGQNGKPNEPDLFLFIINRSAVQKAPSQSPELVRLSRRFATAGWISGDKAYLLGARGDEKLLRSYL
jgi:hypothetical protein